MTTFKYKEAFLGRQKPTAQVSLKTTAGKWVRYDYFVDSGADISLIPLSIGQVIGLSAEGKRVSNISGISGYVKVIYCNIDMKIGSVEFKAQVAWAQTNNVPALLGRKDIFDKFHITFKQDEGKIIFAEVKQGRKR